MLFTKPAASISKHRMLSSGSTAHVSGDGIFHHRVSRCNSSIVHSHNMVKSSLWPLNQLFWIILFAVISLRVLVFCLVQSVDYRSPIVFHIIHSLRYSAIMSGFLCHCKAFSLLGKPLTISRKGHLIGQSFERFHLAAYFLNHIIPHLHIDHAADSQKHPPVGYHAIGMEYHRQSQPSVQTVD